MKKINHTKGPWYPGRAHGAVCSPYETRQGEHPGSLRTYGGHVVCESVSKPENLALISYAPDLYDFLHSVNEWLGICAVGRQSLEIKAKAELLIHEIQEMAEGRR